MTKSLAGGQIDRLKVLKSVGINKDGRVLYECQCDCGNKCVKSSVYLTGKTKIKSCGCARSRDIKGQKYGMLKAIERTKERAYGRAIWKFHCECGKDVLLPLGYVTSGKTWCCGCQKKRKREFQKIA